MRCTAIVLLLGLAAVATTACQQTEGNPQPQQSQVNQDPQIHRESQAGDDSHRNSEAQLGDQPQPTDNPEAGQGTDTDKEPLLLDDDPPLLLDDEPPLLLDDDGQQSAAATGPVADNSRCQVCHLSYMDEELAVVHARANIGCADCHGNCDEHIADESWAWGKNGTPPGIMYPPEKINRFCWDCHPKDKMSTLEHKGFLAGTSKEKYCTDCHGDHRLAKRKCKWK